MESVRRGFSICIALATLSLFSKAWGQDALQLFHKMQTALGGADKIAAVRDFEESVRADAWYSDGRPLGEVRKRTRWIRPNYLRLDHVGPTDTYVLYFDGTAGWEILPDKTMADLAGSELRFARNYLTGLNLNSWLADREPAKVISSSGTNVIVVSTKGDSSQRTEITLDPATFLPAKQTDISLSDPVIPSLVRQSLNDGR